MRFLTDHAAARPFLVSLCACLFLSLVPQTSSAGPVDPTKHRFERIGGGVSGTVKILPLPGTSRALVFLRTGEIHLTTGDGLVRQHLATMPVDSSCGEKGLLSAAWDPNAPGTSLFMTYVDASSGSYTVGRVDVDYAQGSVDLTEVFSLGLPATCTNLGGGIGFGPDDKLYIAMGDHENPAGAVSVTSKEGKIFRMNRDGSLPVPPDEANPLSPTLYFYAKGARNPTVMASDPDTGELWFVDLGGADQDEINKIRPLGNYGWAVSETMGYQDLEDDPVAVFSPAIKPVGLAVYRAANMGPAFNGRLILASELDGEIFSVAPNLVDRRNPGIESLSTPEAGEPASFTSMEVFADGFVYVTAEDGQLHRFRARGGNPLEPSRRESIVPMVLAKAPNGSVDVAMERMNGVEAYGLYVGAIDSLTTLEYTHLDDPDFTTAADANIQEAYTRTSLTMEELGGEGANSYVLAGAANGCIATGVGEDSWLAARPGGLGAGGGTVALLGGGTHDLANVDMSVILTAADGLAIPRDLEFHPDVPGELWVVSRADNSVLIVSDTNGPGQSASYRASPGGGGPHFLAQPAALAFGPGTPYMATIHEEDDYTQGPPPGGTPVDFMGPTLWPSDAADFDAGHASHMDMLHNSPNGVGIAWESGAAYWVYDGWHQSLTRYDFVDDHGPGGSYHGDGIVERFGEGQFGYAPDIPSHLFWEPEDSLVYAADTGNNRIAILDPNTGTNMGPMGPNYDQTDQTYTMGAGVTTFVEGSDFGMMAPSGLEHHDCKVFVSDNATSTIYAFSMAGELVDYLDTGLPPGSLMGIAFDPSDGSLYFVDALQYRVLRLAPR